MQRLTLGHSPDPDDAFMFYAMAKGLIDSHGYDFEHILQDIQTLNERGLMNSDGGRSSFSVLLFQDIAVIFMLALFPLLSSPEIAADAAAHAGRACPPK